MIRKPQYYGRKQNNHQSSPIDVNFKHLINDARNKVNHFQITFRIIEIPETLHVRIAFSILYEIDITQQDLGHFSGRITILKWLYIIYLHCTYSYSTNNKSCVLRLALCLRVKDSWTTYMGRRQLV
jgi:hypothetical protein